MLQLQRIQVRQDHPDFLDLPWHLPLGEWNGQCSRLVSVQRGLSRHEVLFVSYGQAIYAIKELPPSVASHEYDVLRDLEERELPAVLAVGHAVVGEGVDGKAERSMLITRFLDGSLPYRALFMQPGLERYRERLLDAVASLLVRVHLGGFYWGDCSLSNVLFRRDAGELATYVVDAETSVCRESLGDGEREHDLSIMEENVSGDLADLAASMESPVSMEVYSTGANIRARYERLWNEITREQVIPVGESFRIQARIRALNELGFSVGEMLLVPMNDGHHLKLRTQVTDRDYHRHQLHNLTGIVAGNRQATLMINEIRETKAMLSQAWNRSVPLSVASYHWLTERFQPAADKLCRIVAVADEIPEAYCQVLEHKWFLSEKAGKDVGLQKALEDYVRMKTSAREPLAPTTTDAPVEPEPADALSKEPQG